jgi:thiamine biosynthesis lipoprotein
VTSTTAPTSAVREARWRAMGSDAHVLVVDGAPALLRRARERIEELEARWSRFRPDSELCRLNRAAGRPVMCSDETYLAVATAVDGWHRTDGAFDPTVLEAVLATGYQRDFASSTPGPRPAPPRATPGCAGIQLDPLVRAITLPPGVTVDLGGIGKGLAADLVVELLIGAGAAGACVNLGGDLRAVGRPPSDAGWVVDLEHAPDIRVAIGAGAVATTASTRRRWCVDGVEQHHLIDPRTGAPTDGDLLAVTILADGATRAEVTAKGAFVAGADGARAVVERAGVTGLLFTESGETMLLPGIEEFLR